MGRMPVTIDPDHLAALIRLAADPDAWVHIDTEADMERRLDVVRQAIDLLPPTLAAAVHLDAAHTMPLLGCTD